MIVQNNKVNNDNFLIIIHAPNLWNNIQYCWLPDTTETINSNFNNHTKIIKEMNIVQQIGTNRNYKNYVSDYQAWKTISSELQINNINSKNINGIVLEEAEINRRPYDLFKQTVLENNNTTGYVASYTQEAEKIRLSNDSLLYYLKDLDLTVQNNYKLKSLYSDEEHIQQLESLQNVRPFSHVIKSDFAFSELEMVNMSYDNNFVTKITKLLVPPLGKVLLTTRIKYKLIPNNNTYYNLFLKENK